MEGRWGKGTEALETLQRHDVFGVCPATSLLFRGKRQFLLPSHSVVSNCSATQWTLTQQAPLSVGFPRQEHWSGLPSPSPGGLPDAGIETASPASQAGSLPLSLQGSPDANELHSCLCICLYRVLLAARMSFELWYTGLLPQPWTEPRPRALGVQS